MTDTAPDIQASLENAEEIAKLTGRDKADVIADLLDDGKLNNSNAIKENTSALDRATEMAGKTQKLLTAIIPIMILLAGSGLELGGIINLTPAGSDEPFWEDEPDYEIYWGCTDYYAENYDEWANEDDGSCYYEEEVWGCTNSTAINYNEEATDDDGTCEYEEPEPEYCEINLYDIAFGTNTSAASVAYDLDCGYEPNDLDGYNVSIQFLVYHVNETNSGENATGPIQWVETTHYIEGWAEDVNTLLLDEFVANNTTHYDFYWYAFWTDGEGEYQIVEHKWLNRELDSE